VAGAGFMPQEREEKPNMFTVACKNWLLPQKYGFEGKMTIRK
jgi:hypothetical protein